MRGTDRTDYDHDFKMVRTILKKYLAGDTDSLNREIMAVFSILTDYAALQERDALKAEVEKKDAHIQTLLQDNNDLRSLLVKAEAEVERLREEMDARISINRDLIIPCVEARAEKAEAERDEWRDKATKSVTREWVADFFDGGLIDTAIAMLKSIGVVVEDGK